MKSIIARPVGNLKWSKKTIVKFQVNMYIHMYNTAEIISSY